MKYNVVITRKNIKNMILKVKEDGQILLSVPRRTPDSYVKSFIKSKEEWIEKILKKIEEATLNNRKTSYKNGEVIRYLGKEYILNIVNSSKEKVELIDNSITISTINPDEEKIKKMIYEMYFNEAKNILITLLKRYSEMLKVDIREVKIKKLKSCWGNCRYHKKMITLNVELMKTPIEFIEYVVLHEVAHLIYPNHQKEYWDYMTIHMPDWKVRRKLGKNING